MASDLEECPNEIIERIAMLMTLGDICSLRQTSRTLSFKTTQNHFKSYFRRKQVDVTRDSLKNLVNSTKPGRLGCVQLRELKLTGVVNNTKRLEATVRNRAGCSEETCTEARRHLNIVKQRQRDYKKLHRSGRDVTLLGEAFSNLATRSENTEPLSLSLGIMVYRTDSE